MKTIIMKYLCLAVAMLASAQPASALLMTFSNSSYESSDATVDWSDNNVSLNFGQIPQFWQASTDRMVGPNYMIFQFRPQWLSDVYGMPAGVWLTFTLNFLGERPEITGLGSYLISDKVGPIADTVDFMAQGESSITFHLFDGNHITPNTVPENGASLSLFTVAFAGLIAFRRFIAP